MATQHPGRLITVLVQEGATVKAGNVIVLLDTVDLNAQLSEANALARQTKESIKRAKANLTYQKAQLLVEIKNKSGQTMSHR